MDCQIKQHFLCKTMLFVVLSLFLQTTLAGPPFITEDPEPVDYKHYEIYLYSSVETLNSTVNFQAPALDWNYGLIPNVEINVVIPFAINVSNDAMIANGAGLGDIQLGFDWRFIQESAHIPQVGFKPFYIIPTGDSARGLGNSRPMITLPLWIQKSWGPLTTYGGGGYTINQAPGMFNYFFGGMVVQYDLNDTWTLGGEVFTQGAISSSTGPTVIANFGGNYNVTKNFSILFSGGHSINNTRSLVAYMGLHWVI